MYVCIRFTVWSTIHTIYTVYAIHTIYTVYAIHTIYTVYAIHMNITVCACVDSELEALANSHQ